MKNCIAGTPDEIIFCYSIEITESDFFISKNERG